MKTSALRKEDHRIIPFVLPGNAGKADDPKQEEPAKIRYSTQTLAIVFTDLTGSSALKSELGIHKAQSLEIEHKQLLIESLRKIQDIYQDNIAQAVRVEGDSYIFVFSNPGEAVHFALLAQRLHHEARLTRGYDLPRFRVGIHTGEVIVEDGLKGSDRPGGIGDIRGLQADTTARIMSLACGGQILCSHAAFDNARQSLTGIGPEGVSDRLVWKSHGFYLLKGRDEPLEICEVGEKTAAPMKKPVGNEKAKQVVSESSKYTKRILTAVILLVLGSATLWAYPKIIRVFSAETIRSVNPSEKTLEELRCKVVELWGVFQSLESYGSQVISEIREKTPQIGQQIINLADKDMDTTHVIMKYQNISYCITMAASVETDTSEKIAFANQAIDAGRKTLALIENVKLKASGGDKEAYNLYDWIESGHQREITHFVIAVCSAIKARLGDQAAYEDVEKHLNSIPCAYQEKYPPQMDPDLKWYLEESPRKNSVKICVGRQN